MVLNYVFVNLKDFKGKKSERLEKIDMLFLKKLNSLIKSVTESFENYEYNKARAETENFFWHDFCDNYLEIVKNRVYNEKGVKRESAQYTLYQSLFTILKLIAPIMPFITEELYQQYFRRFEKQKSIHLCDWPEYIKKDGEIKELDLFYNILSEIRQEKTKKQKSMKAEIKLIIGKKQIENLHGMIEDLKAVVNAKEIKESKQGFKVEFV